MQSFPRSYGPPPNYTRRRLVAATVLVLLLLGIWRIFSSLTGGDGEATLQTATSMPPTTVRQLEPPPSCDFADEPTVYAREEDWFRTIVDPTYAIPDDYVPSDLVPASEANYSAEFRIRAIIADDLNGMRNGILEAGLPEVALLAAYRSIEDQQSLFSRREEGMGFAAATEGTARPGHSEHHLGTTIDVRPIGETDVDESFGKTPTGQWIQANSWRYGFIVSYPEGKQDVTCYKYEPWHLRYVGPDLAAKVTDSGLTLREYLWHWEVTGSEPGRQPGTTVPDETEPTDADPVAPDTAETEGE